MLGVKVDFARRLKWATWESIPEVTWVTGDDLDGEPPGVTACLHRPPSNAADGGRWMPRWAVVDLSGNSGHVRLSPGPSA
jgi:hypothetical protein